MRFFFEDANFPRTAEVNDTFLVEVENCIRKGFLVADMALGEDSSVSSSSGTTALMALIIGRYSFVLSSLYSTIVKQLGENVFFFFFCFKKNLVSGHFTFPN